MFFCVVRGVGATWGRGYGASLVRGNEGTHATCYVLCLLHAMHGQLDGPALHASMRLDGLAPHFQLGQRTGARHPEHWQACMCLCMCVVKLLSQLCDPALIYIRWSRPVPGWLSRILHRRSPTGPAWRALPVCPTQRTRTTPIRRTPPARWRRDERCCTPQQAPRRAAASTAARTPH